MAPIEVPAKFSSMEQESPNPKVFRGGAAMAGGVRSWSVHQVVVDDANAPNRSKREARALLRNVGAPREALAEQGTVTDLKRANSFLYDS